MTHPLEDVRESELLGLVRAALRLHQGRALGGEGRRPHRLRPGGGSEFLDHRELQPGDDPREVDWRATARSPHPLVRRFRDERTQDWHLCLDRSASMSSGGGRKWALAVQLAAALAYILLALDHRVGLLLFSAGLDDLRRPGRGREAYAGLLRTLWAAAPASAGGASRLETCAGQIRRGGHCLVIGDFLAEDGMLPALSILAGICDRVHCLRIADPSDVAVPALGALTLEDLESGGRMSAVLDRGAGLAPARRQEALGTALEQHCRRLHIDLTLCSALSPWRRVVVDHLRGLETAGA